MQRLRVIGIIQQWFKIFQIVCATRCDWLMVVGGPYCFMDGVDFAIKL